MQYYMTSYRHSDISYWEPCRAKTLRGAKREATICYQNDTPDSVIKISTGDNVTEVRQLVATKRNNGEGWVAR